MARLKSSLILKMKKLIRLSLIMELNVKWLTLNSLMGLFLIRQCKKQWITLLKRAGVRELLIIKCETGV